MHTVSAPATIGLGCCGSIDGESMYFHHFISKRPFIWYVCRAPTKQTNVVSSAKGFVSCCEKHPTETADFPYQVSIESFTVSLILCRVLPTSCGTSDVPTYVCVPTPILSPSAQGQRTKDNPHRPFRKTRRTNELGTRRIHIRTIGTTCR